MGKAAVIMDVMSIQQYVFASNTLIDNLGASHIVEHIFDNCEAYFKPEKMNDGGGNAILVFDKEGKDAAIEKIKSFTRNLLIQAPGLILGAAVVDDFDEHDFSNSMASLHKALQKSKNLAIPNTHLPMHGITAECQTSGLSTEFYDSSKNQWVSSVVQAKRQAIGKWSGKKETDFSPFDLLKKSSTNNEDITNIEKLEKKYVFTNELDKLGQSKGDDSHIAVVHIDGNDMGKRFMDSASWESYLSLSKKVKHAVANSFFDILKAFDKDKNSIENDIDLKEEGRKIVFPIRPIIMGGDDITFVSDGRLGIYFAIKFMEAFANQTDEQGTSLRLSSCAGVSIVKTKYPFYRANELAIELCSNAKKKRRTIKSDSSFIDFHISYGGLGTSLKEMRKRQYFSSDGYSVLARPFCIDDFSAANGLLGAVKSIGSLPNSNIKELRQMLYASESEQIQFLNQMKFRGKSFPKVLGQEYDEKLFHDTGFTGTSDPKKYSHILDVIELSELYPKSLYNGKERISNNH